MAYPGTPPTTPRPSPSKPVTREPLSDDKSELLIYRVLAEHEGRIAKAEDRLAALEAASPSSAAPGA